MNFAMYCGYIWRYKPRASGNQLLFSVIPAPAYARATAGINNLLVISAPNCHSRAGGNQLAAG